MTDYHVFARGCTGEARTVAPHANAPSPTNQSIFSPRKKKKIYHGWVANQDALFFSLLRLPMRGMQIFRRTWKTSS